MLCMLRRFLNKGHDGNFDSSHFSEKETDNRKLI